MAASAFTQYSESLLALTKAQMNLAADTFQVALLTAAYVPGPAHKLWSDVSANELASGGGYAQGGLTLGGQSDLLAAGVVTFTTASPSWPAFTAGPFRYAVVVRRAAAALAPGDLLLCFSDLTAGVGTLTGSGGAFRITIGADGILHANHTP